jgi:catechol 2,3-dioxygenase-like lactoylglutathione lyase family enzyme
MDSQKRKQNEGQEMIQTTKGVKFTVMVAQAHRKILRLILGLLIGMHSASSFALESGANEGAAGVARSQQKIAAKDVELSITSRIHYNINVSDFERSRSFYKLLGFSDSIAYPETNTLEVAQSMGIDHKYLLRAELLFQSNFSGGFIDLIEWTNPRDDDPPYSDLYHLGIASATLLSTDLDADIFFLKSRDIEFSSAPAARPDGSRFVILKDPNGTYLELLETEARPGQSQSDVNIVGLGKININVSDLERSKAFYEMLGFSAQPVELGSGDTKVAEALGVDPSYAYRKVLMHHRGDGSAIELTEWQRPLDDSPPYPAPINHIGIHRIAYSTNDLHGDVAKLKAQGVKFLSEPAPCCDGPDSTHSIVVFYDPDGIFFELVDTDENYWEQVKAAYYGK